MELDRSKAPAFKVPEDFVVTDPEKYFLKNGATLYFFKTPNIGAVKLDVVGASRRLNLDLTDQMVPRFCLQMLLDGTGKYSSEGISDILDFHASEVTPLTSFSHEGLRLLSTKKQFWNVYPLFLSLFEEATFPEDFLEKKKSQKKLQLKIEREKTSSKANQLFREALFGSQHPFAFETIEDNVDGLTRSKLQEYYTNSLWSELEIFLSADLTTQELEALILSLEVLPNRKLRSLKEWGLKPENQRLNMTKEGAMQSSLRMGGPSLPMTHPDFFALGVFNTFLGGYFGSRLIKNIREDKGHTYGIYSSLQVIDQYDYWMIGAEVQRDFKEEVIFEVKQEIDRLVHEKISSDELETVRNYSVGKMISQFSNSFDLMERFKSVHRNNLSMRFYRDKLAYLKMFTAEDILEVGAKYFSQEPEIQITVG